ncbi:Tyrosine-protein kinase, catalytic domain [Sesbania bispinosa]|nr:Tyrosine-protein kinase, catalytic domain [Sesbania bispinosa]
MDGAHCLNDPGSYKCFCPHGNFGDGTITGGCHPLVDVRTKVIIGVFAGLGSVILLLGLWWLHKVIRRKMVKKRKEKFFKLNGGMLLEQKLSSSEVSLDKAKVFSLKDLEKATDHFNMNRVLGKGSQGCCLETEIPLLVYEFIPNGNLYEHLHEQSDDLPMTWDMRLRIATEIAGAYKAKVADFGASRMVSTEATHLTTMVQGQKAISSLRQEAKSLASYFNLSMEENRLFDIIDERVMKEGGKENIIAVANLASRCLELNGKKRPTMKEVTLELEGIRKLAERKSNTAQENHEEHELAEIEDYQQSWDVYSISNTGFTLDSETATSEVMPILIK